MTLASRENRTTLPVDRAFVVQFSGETNLTDGRLGGRVEHVDSGRSERFESLEQLMAFVGNVMSEKSKGAERT